MKIKSALPTVDGKFNLVVEHSTGDGKDYCYYVDMYVENVFHARSGYQVLVPNEIESVQISTLFSDTLFSGKQIEFRLRAVERTSIFGIPKPCPVETGYTTWDTMIMGISGTQPDYPWSDLYPDEEEPPISEPWPDELPEPKPYEVISPAGIGTDCKDILALSHNGKKWWLTPNEYHAIGGPKWTEVSLTKFNSIPDSSTSITYLGVTIPGRTTVGYCTGAVPQEPSQLPQIGDELLCISPVGDEAGCNAMIALIYNDKKYWLIEEYAALGYPPVTDVTMKQFVSIPDGTQPITVAGVTIIPRDTSIYCKDVGEDNTLLYIAVFIAALLMFKGGK